MTPIRFEPLAGRHLPLLTRWLQAPHVRAFWDDGERDEAAVRAHYFRPGRDVPGFVFLIGEEPAGFLQTERVMPEHEFWPWSASKGETWGMDLLIGKETLTGQGWGPRVIEAFLHFWQEQRPALRRVLIDPSPDNGRALKAYARAGFTPLGTHDGEDGPVVLMGLELSP